VGHHSATPDTRQPVWQRCQLSFSQPYTYFNKQVNKIRYVIEQVIANFKTWRIMHTDYRRPIGTFTETISAVVGLHFYKLAE
jgi:hypothetical protein